MKYLRLLLLLLLITACGSSKKAIEKDETQVKTKNTTIQVTESIEVNTNDGKIIGEIGATESSEEMIKENTEQKKDTLGFYQELTKREGPLHFLLDELLLKHVSEEGNVDYKSFKTNHGELLGYIYVLQMAYPKLEELRPSREQKLAYWINAYNALTIDLIIRNYPVKSIKDIKDPWEQRLWKFGNKWLNLNDIEHEILRKMDEPRIHFAIVCASFSCPKLQNTAFIAKDLDSQLTKATKEFLNDSERNIITENQLEISKIFKWFAKDFKTEGSLIDFLNKYSDIEISSKAKKSFLDYNWDLND